MASQREWLLADIAALAPRVAARAAEIESARRMPLDLVHELKAIGIYRMFVPKSLGGLEMEPPVALKAIEMLGRADGSTGWSAIVNSGAALFAPMLPASTFEQMYRNGPDVILAGSAYLSGTATRDSGGDWRLSGRWPFASGSEHSDWILGMCSVMEDGKPVLKPDGGAPLTRAFFLPTRDWIFEDSWDVMGLAGTGSCHIALKDALVPEAYFFDLANPTFCLDGPLYRGGAQMAPLFHGAVHLGMAQGAVDDVVDLAQSGWRQERSASSLRDSDVFQLGLGRAQTALRAAQAVYDVQVATHWAHCVAGTVKGDLLLAQNFQTAIWVAQTCLSVVTACFELAGSRAIFDDSPLQRRLRDMQVAAQHGTVQQRKYVNGGKAVLQSGEHEMTRPERLELRYPR